VKKDDIIAALRRVGLQPGDHVVVHSSLKSFGHVDGGPDAVIDALEDAVTKCGTVVMPTYSGQLIYVLERLALRAGVNGAGSGRGTVFEGSLSSLFEELRNQAYEGGVPYPFATPRDLFKRFSGERKFLERNGWRMEFLGSSPNSAVRLTRDAPPLAEEDIKPWRMPVWTGAIPEAFWRRPETIRSHQYSGSFSAWGRLAEKILEGHDDRPGHKFEDHPLYRLMVLGGKILLLGVDHRSNSSIHVAEWAALRELDPGGLESRREFVEDFESINQPLVEAGGQRETELGSCRIRLALSVAVFDVVRRILLDILEREGSAPSREPASTDS